MTNRNINLNPKLFDEQVERKPTRDGYGTGLLGAGEENARVVALTADLAESTRSLDFARRFPGRFFDLGVAEQNLVGVASGLAATGKVPYIASYAAFCPGRTWEQIRTTVCYNNANVKIAGHHGGLSAAADGATHQALEDVALMRVLPNMKVIVPCDAIQAHKATLAAARIMGPVYLRFFREPSPIMTCPRAPFVIGKILPMYVVPRPRVVIFSQGPVLYNALIAARLAKEDDLAVAVYNVHTVKPLNPRNLLECLGSAHAVVVVEEGQVAGSLGGAIAEVLAKVHPVPMEFVGIQDAFGQSGTIAELEKHHGLNAKDILRAVKRAVRRA